MACTRISSAAEAVSWSSGLLEGGSRWVVTWSQVGPACAHCVVGARVSLGKRPHSLLLPSQTCPFQHLGDRVSYESSSHKLPKPHFKPGTATQGTVSPPTPRPKPYKLPVPPPGPPCVSRSPGAVPRGRGWWPRGLCVRKQSNPNPCPPRSRVGNWGPEQAAGLAFHGKGPAPARTPGCAGSRREAVLIGSF